jgi:hypothetical protein
LKNPGSLSCRRFKTVPAPNRDIALKVLLADLMDDDDLEDQAGGPARRGVDRPAGIP